MADILQAIIEGRHKFFITTEKRVQLKEGSPCLSSEVTKISQYTIIVRDDYQEHENGDLVPFWASPSIVPDTMAHNRNGNIYLMVSMDRESNIRGRSEFVDMAGETFSKNSLFQWLPEQGKDFPEIFSLKVESIVAFDILDEELVAVEEEINLSSPIWAR